jgi:outer membrane lipoprotein-sorting protein
MNKNFVIILVVVTVLLVAILAFAGPVPRPPAGRAASAGLAQAAPASEERALAIVKKIDDLYRAKSSYARVEMEIVTPDWQRTLVLKAWSRGEDKTLIRILEPKKEAGVGTLRIGNEMWNYLPNTDKIIKIPPSMMMSSWMGSDFTNDDLVKEYTFVHDFLFHMTAVDKPETGLLYVECRPKPDVPIVWDHIVLAVREADFLPVWQKYYDEKGRVARLMTYSDIKTFGRRTIPSVMEMVPQMNPGHKTTLRYEDVQFDIPLSDSVFSLRNLQSGRY